MKEKTVCITLLSGEQVTLNVKRRIKYSDLSTIASAIRNDVFADGGYFPYMKDLGLVHYTMLYYAGYAFENADEMMELDAAGAFDSMYKAIDPEQLNQLNEIVCDMIDYQRSRSGLDAVCSIMLNELKKQKQVVETKE